MFDAQTKTLGPAAGFAGRETGRRIVVLGLGNILLKDEGVGAHVAEQLVKLELGDNVEVIDGGTAGLDILLSQEPPYKLIVVDAMKGGQESGTIYKARFAGEDRNGVREVFGRHEHSSISLHQIGLIEALAMAEKTHCAPEEIVIIGIEPEQIDCGLELTEPVARRVPEIINTVLEEIEDAVHDG
ncbi:MAG: hydrogenase maturation protease [Planctomycetota bacterium]